MENQTSPKPPVAPRLAWTQLIMMLSAIVIIMYSIGSLYKKVNNVGKVDKLTIKEFIVSVQPKDPPNTTADSLYRILHSGVDSLLDMSMVLSKEEREAYDERLMGLVALCGALGSMIHILSSFTNFWGSQKLERSWLPWYVAKPFVGAGLALIVYFVMRAGFLSTNVTTGDLNLFGILAIASFVGLFTDIATQKLKEVFGSLFNPKDDHRPDKLGNGQDGGVQDGPGGSSPDGPGSPGLEIVGFKPKEVPANIETEMQITGRNLSADAHVKCGAEIVPDADIKSRDSNVILFKFPKTDPATKEIKLYLYDPEQNKDLEIGTVVVKG